MNYKMTFKRYELKYLLTLAQKERIMRAMSAHMALDEYGRSSIRNIYFDTQSYRLIRQSIEKPVYKEKLRIRSYGQASPGSDVFVELKKKYRDVVYKRRLSMPERQAMGWLSGEPHIRRDGQIADEIDYFLSYYGTLRPTVFLSYERAAFYAQDGTGFRVTFDDEILCRREALSLESGVWGVPLLEEGAVLMELKCSGGIPLWMTHALTRERLCKTSFSKYGAAYEKILLPDWKERDLNVQIAV